MENLYQYEFLFTSSYEEDIVEALEKTMGMNLDKKKANVEYFGENGNLYVFRDKEDENRFVLLESGEDKDEFGMIVVRCNETERKGVHDVLYPICKEIREDNGQKMPPFLPNAIDDEGNALSMFKKWYSEFVI